MNYILSGGKTNLAKPNNKFSLSCSIACAFALASIGISFQLYNMIASLGFLAFPLDDAWIHQTLARNLIRSNTWGINPGEPVSASSSPIWTLCVSPAYLLDVSPILWTHLLNILSLFAVLPISLKIAQTRLFLSMRFSLLALLLIATRWQLLWSTLSGMETIMFSLVLLIWVLCVAGSERVNSTWAAVVVTVMIALRPEAIITIPITTICVSRNKRKRTALLYLIQQSLFILPYIAFNLCLSDFPLPTTVYAKSLRFLGNRTTFLFALPGVLGAYLLPFAAHALITNKSVRSFLRLAPAVWFLILQIGTALVLLPALYHHGRYFIAFLPVICLWAVRSIQTIYQNHSRIGVALVCLLAVFSALDLSFHYNTLTQNSQNINKMQIAAADWIKCNTAPSDRIAADDIGALSYFGARYVIGLRGIQNPAVLKVQKDEIAWHEWLSNQQVDYMIIYPEHNPYMKSIENKYLTIMEFYDSDKSICAGSVLSIMTNVDNHCSSFKEMYILCEIIPARYTISKNFN